jgi:hypothetical protein
VLQQTLDGLQVCYSAWQRLHQARSASVPDVQAAAFALVARQPGILDSAANGNGPLVLCHVIADADVVNKRGSYE